MESSIDELMNTLECPICLDTADKPPIFQCPEGHLICESCSQHLDACPQCSHALMNSRNRTAEELASKLEVIFKNNIHHFTYYNINYDKTLGKSKVYFPFRHYVPAAAKAKTFQRKSKIFPSWCLTHNEADKAFQ